MRALGCWACQGGGNDSLEASRKAGPLWYGVSGDQDAEEIQLSNSTCQLPSSASLGLLDDMTYSFDWHLYSPSSWVSDVWSIPQLLTLNLLIYLMCTFIQNPTLIKFYQTKVTEKHLVLFSLFCWIEPLMTPCFSSTPPDRPSFHRKIN